MNNPTIRVKIYDLDCRTHLCDQMFEVGTVISVKNLGIPDIHKGHRILRFNAKKPHSSNNKPIQN